jgi:hypothetical protein
VSSVVEGVKANDIGTCHGLEGARGGGGGREGRTVRQSEDSRQCGHS